MIDPLKDSISSVELLRTSGTDLDVVSAARISFAGEAEWEWVPDSEDACALVPVLSEKDRKLLTYLLKNHHSSVLEHTQLVFRVKCPIFVDRQFARHRIGVSKNEISARYTEVKDEWYTPPQFRAQAKSNRQASVEAGDDLNQKLAREAWQAAVVIAYATYQGLLSLGVTREQARGVLPQGAYTSSLYTFNLRSLLHFLDLRDHPGSQFESQQFARAMYELARPYFPEVFSAYASLKKEN